MWFKNILLYEMLEPLPYDTDEFLDKLEKKAIRPTQKTEKETLGWISPFHHVPDIENPVFSHVVNNCYLLKACKEIRLLPSTVIQEHVNERIKEIEKSEHRKVYRREKARIKDDVTFDLLPKAFTRRVYTDLYIDTSNRYIIIDSSSRAVAESILQLLRDTIGNIKLALPEFDKSPSRLMTEWLNDQGLPDYISIEDSCELMEIQNGDGIIRCKRQDLYADEIQSHLKSGKQVVKLGITWRDRMCLTLEHDFALKRIQCLDLIEDKRKDSDLDIETEQQKIDADFSIMNAEFKNLVTDMYSLLHEVKANSKVKEEAAVE